MCVCCTACLTTATKICAGHTACVCVWMCLWSHTPYSSSYAKIFLRCDRRLVRCVSVYLDGTAHRDLRLRQCPWSWWAVGNVRPTGTPRCRITRRCFMDLVAAVWLCVAVLCACHCCIMCLVNTILVVQLPSQWFHNKDDDEREAYRGRSPSVR